MSKVNGGNKHVLELMGTLLSLFGDTGAESGWRKELKLQLLQLLHTGSEQGGFESLLDPLPGGQLWRTVSMTGTTVGMTGSQCGWGCEQ